jgi:Zn-dependent protease with chaperone function
MGELVLADGDRVRFGGISSRAYEHPADGAALGALRKLRGLDTAVKKFQSLFPERLIRMEHLGSAVRTSDRQFGRLHAMVRDAAAVLDLPRVPELYVKQSPELNAYTMGMAEPFVVLHTALVDLMDADELRFIVGHELGHAMSGHCMYHTIARHLVVLGAMAASVPLGGIGVQVLLAALGEWSRKSELSSDRAGLLVGQDRQAALRALMKLAGGSHLHEMDIEEFLLQAAEYARVGDVRDTMARVMLAGEASHPLVVVRVAELDGWACGEQYLAALAGDYPLRDGDRAASLTQDLRAVAGGYGRRAKDATAPMLTRGAALGRRVVGRGKDEPAAIEASPPAWQAAPVWEEAPAWLTALPAELPPDTPSWPTAPPVD